MYCFNIVTSKKHLKNNYYLTLKHSSQKKKQKVQTSQLDLKSKSILC